MAAGKPSEDGVVVIKKYANRRLYDTESSTYITLDRIGQMVREKRDFKVVDAKSGEDITHNVLTQIIMDEEQRGGSTMLPVNFLRQLIGMYGNSMQSFVPQYLEASLEALQQNQAKFAETMTGAFGGPAFANNPFAELARRNMEMFAAATSGMTPGVNPVMPTPGPAPTPADGETKSELADLRAALAEMQKKIDKLGG